MLLMSHRGYSLVELLVAMTITGLAATAIIGVFISQNRAHVAQENVSDMQQNIRAGFSYMTREIRMAGYDPLNTGTIGFFPAGTTPSLSSITFQLDITGGEADGIDNDGDGTPDEPEEAAFGDGDALDANEQITYGLFGTNTLWRLSDAGSVYPDDAEAVAEEIDALSFAYAYDADGDGELDRSGGNVIFAIVGSDGAGTFGTDNWYDLDGNNTGTTAQTADIRAVRIWVLARTGNVDPDYFDGGTYTVGTQSITPNDRRHRRLLDTAVRCRNMGL